MPHRSFFENLRTYVKKIEKYETRKKWKGVKNAFSLHRQNLSSESSELVATVLPLFQFAERDEFLLPAISRPCEIWRKSVSLCSDLSRVNMHHDEEENKTRLMERVTIVVTKCFIHQFSVSSNSRDGVLVPGVICPYSPNLKRFTSQEMYDLYC